MYQFTRICLVVAPGLPLEFLFQVAFNLGKSFQPIAETAVAIVDTLSRDKLLVPGPSEYLVVVGRETRYSSAKRLTCFSGLPELPNLLAVMRR